MASASRTMILALVGVLATLLAGAQGKSELCGRVVSEARGTAAVTLPRRARLSQEFTLISEGRFYDFVDELVLPTTVAAMETSPRGVGAPLAYQPSNGSCGVVLIWSK